MAGKFILSGFSDEIDKSTDLQFQHLNKLGISYFEPRGIDGKNISELTEQEAKDLKRKMDGYGINASSIGSPIGKIFITDDFLPHMDKLKRVIETAKILDTEYIRMFSFFIPKGDEPEKYRTEVMERLGEMVALAEKEGVVLLHENEKEIYGDVAVRCRDIFETIQSPAFGAVFDPANFVQCGQKVYPEAFDMLAPYIRYMHIKDAKEDGTVVPAGYGNGKVREILTELSKRNYEGFVSLEPHLGSFAGLSDLELSDNMLSLEESGPDKFKMAYQALQNILEAIQ